MGLLPWKLIAAEVLETVCTCRGQSANYQTDYNQLSAGTETADGRETSRICSQPLFAPDIRSLHGIWVRSHGSNMVIILLSTL